MPRVLIIFSGAGLIMHLNEGAKHRLNCYINCYKEAGYEVCVYVCSRILAIGNL